MRTLLVFAVLTLVACGGSDEARTADRACGSPAAPRPPAADSRPAIVAFGDSLSAGFGLDAGQSFPDLLQQDLDRRGLRYRVVNMGISGDTTQDGLARMSLAHRRKARNRPARTGRQRRPARRAHRGHPARTWQK